MVARLGLDYDEVVGACDRGFARRRHEVEIGPSVIVIYAELSSGQWVVVRAQQDSQSNMRWVRAVRLANPVEVKELDEEP